jgi:hypothetical protein
MLLRYRRQFLLSREAIPGLGHWRLIVLTNGDHLYVHPDLPITHKVFGGIELALLGFLFDAFNYQKGNSDILEDIGRNLDTFDTLAESLGVYAGRFVLICLRDNGIKVLHDALGLREVYYCAEPNRVICGSQPTLISQYASPRLNITADPAILSFDQCDRKRVRDGRFWVGDETIYDGIKHLLPNHFLDVASLGPKRYWPRKRLSPKDIHDIAQYSCAHLKGILKAASQRYELMMAVTAGTDSRTLLAASREIKDKIYYFINQHQGVSDGHPDIQIPRTIFKKIALPFHVHRIQGHVDEDFREIFLSNTQMSSEKLLPAVFNVYFRQHSHRLNVQGVGEIGRAFYGNEPHNLDGYYLARSLKFRNSHYAVEQCQKWLDDALPSARSSGANIMTLLLWEQLLGNWGAVGHSEADIAIEIFNPFNCHYIYELMMSVDPKQIGRHEGILFKEMTDAMWPELQAFPINPPVGFPIRAKLHLQQLGLLGPIKQIAYFIDRFRYGLSVRRKSDSNIH